MIPRHALDVGRAGGLSCWPEKHGLIASEHGRVCTLHTIPCECVCAHSFISFCQHKISTARTDGLRRMRTHQQTFGRFAVGIDAEAPSQYSSLPL